MSATGFRRKTPTEEVIFVRDWSKDFSTGEDIVDSGSSTWAASPSGLTFSDADISANKLTANAKISGGTVNTDYKVTNTVITSLGQKLEYTWLLRVRASMGDLASYTTLDRMQRELDVVEDSVLDLLESFIVEATKLIDAFCGRTFGKQTDMVEKLKGTDHPVLLLQHTPVIDIDGITMDGQAISEDDYSIDDAAAGVLYRATGWTSKQVFVDGLTTRPLPNSKESSIVVTYTAGYILPGTAGRTLPNDIERACIAIVKNWHQKRFMNSNVKSEKVDEIYNVTYGDQVEQDIPMEAQLLLSRWKRTTIL